MQNDDFKMALVAARKLEKSMDIDVAIPPCIVEKRNIIELEARGRQHEWWIEFVHLSRKAISVTKLMVLLVKASIAYECDFNDKKIYLMAQINF